MIGFMRLPWPPLALRTRKVLDALTDNFAAPGVIAERAGLPARSRIEEAARLCGYLVKLGLAERQEGRWRRWRRARPDAAAPVSA
jgi:hypothetical protein